jgi:mandelate racemase
VKLRLGRPDAKQDMQVLKAVKKQIGPEVTLMVDFNQGLTVAEAIRRGRMIDDEGGVYWIEEPVRADDFSGCSQAKQAIHTPVQIGENFMGPEQMSQALAAGACDYVMPDAGRIGGVTGWMRAAALAHDLPLSRVRRLGRRGARAAAPGQGRPGRRALDARQRHPLERERGRALPRLM